MSLSPNKRALRKVIFNKRNFQKKLFFLALFSITVSLKIDESCKHLPFKGFFFKNDIKKTVLLKAAN
jgi:hypothetical protein